MILIDVHQLAYATILEHLGSTRTTKIDLTTARILILDTIRANVFKFKHTYGPTVVIAIDDDSYWRKSIFPHYKFHRKKIRDDSPFDWESIHAALAVLRVEMLNHLPYKVLQVPECEADDIIGTLTLRHAPHEKIMIVSSDGDFRQLHTHSNVNQYAPAQKKLIVEKAPTCALKEKIIRGDKGDGIPNILSVDRSFVDGIRQKAIREVKVTEWLLQPPTAFCEGEMLRNFDRNRSLIDLTLIPQNYQNSIVAAFEAAAPKTKMDFMNYLTTHPSGTLMNVLQDF